MKVDVVKKSDGQKLYNWRIFSTCLGHSKKFCYSWNIEDPEDRDAKFVKTINVSIIFRCRIFIEFSSKIYIHKFKGMSILICINDIKYIFSRIVK